MAESNIIQEARDVLAKLRDNVTSPLPWAIENDGQDNITVDARHVDIVQLSSREAASWASLDDADARLIVVIAGNRDLLDAIDGMLANAYNSGSLLSPNWYWHAESIAAAIVAANERMSA